MAETLLAMTFNVRYPIWLRPMLGALALASRLGWRPRDAEGFENRLAQFVVDHANITFTGHE